MKYIISRSIICAAMMLTLACKSFVEIEAPKDQIPSKKIYLNDELAIAAIRGIYSQMMSSISFASGGVGSVTVLAGRSADDYIDCTTAGALQFSTNELSPANSELQAGLWQSPYKIIYYANSVLEGLEHSANVSAALKTQLMAEAKFVRAFCYFYLTNLFGIVPLILGTDYRLNAVAPSTRQNVIYEQMIKDLKAARIELSEAYPTPERVRPNKAVATALLARVYLYQEDWLNAEAMATAVIEKDNDYKILDDLDQVFLKNSLEAIFQMPPVTNNINTREGQLFILNTAPGAATNVILNDKLVKDFEDGDRRLAKWVGKFSNTSGSWHYPFKYKVKTNTVVTEYSMVLRLAEQYLIRAEARTKLGKYEAARDDLNVIRKRANLENTSFDTEPELLMAIERERRMELFAEWGHRWLDLKRTKRADAVLAPLKTPNWQATDVLYPIPAAERAKNINLEQNNGY
uniref:RagB/SusD family nutrient uptake outer membrane protein n=1 Tax=Pedobacter schmidteae TaxID=2201271 RepID=UPI000EB0BE8A|nr:RagB/SusD family nutrient uptake outer membrane protein [Pedobacter schmidteae]